MDATTPKPALETPSPPISIFSPGNAPVPLIVASPHSGTTYPDAFLQQSRLDPMTLRRSEDTFVDQLMADTPSVGGTLLTAHFPRIYCDVNRHAWELDPGMFRDTLPAHAHTRTPKVRAGLGMIPRIGPMGRGIYREQLSVDDATNRIDAFWRPYHSALQTLMATTHDQFGFVVVIDAHSMPTLRHRSLPDIILGDAHGTSTKPDITDLLQKAFQERGYTVGRNAPYAGGYTTQHYGRPVEGQHVVQIEMARALYMDEETLTPHGGLPRLRGHLREILADLVATLV